MSISLAAVHTPPSYGLAHVPEVAEQAELVTTFVPSRFKTYSLDDTFSTKSETDTKASIPGVARPLDGVPRREQIPVVTARVDIGLDGQAGQLRLRVGGSRDSRLHTAVSKAAMEGSIETASEQLTGVGTGMGIALTAAAASSVATR